MAITAVIDDQDRVLMLWRYRFVPQQWGWELPGGIVDEGEDALTTAARETEEETGRRPTNLEHVVTYQPMIGVVDSPHEIFVAQGAVKVGEPTDAEEAGHVAWVPLADVPKLMAASNEYCTVWDAAREAVLTPAEVKSGMAAVPYCLRHAAVSLWIKQGVDPVEVAYRADHSVAVLYRFYAKLLKGSSAHANSLIQKGLEEAEGA